MAKTVKYHIKPDGTPGACVAEKGRCFYGKDGNDPEHYSTKEEARLAYEDENSQNTFSSLGKTEQNNTKIDISTKDYVFNKSVEDYGVSFGGPDVDDFYMENIDGAEWYRFDALDEIYGDFDENDVQNGYTMNADMITLQSKVSEDVIEDYKKANTHSSMFYDSEYNEEENHNSPMRFLVHKNKAYLIDGNHRFIASKQSGKKTFEGIVIGMNDDMTRMWTVSPSKFNRMFG